MIGNTKNYSGQATKSAECRTAAAHVVHSISQFDWADFAYWTALDGCTEACWLQTQHHDVKVSSYQRPKYWQTSVSQFQTLCSGSHGLLVTPHYHISVYGHRTIFLLPTLLSATLLDNLHYPSISFKCFKCQLKDRSTTATMPMCSTKSIQLTYLLTK